MFKRLKSVGWLLILLGLLNTIGAASKWYFRTDPLPIAVADLIRTISMSIAFIMCGLALLKAPDEPWRWRELFDRIVQHAPLSYRVILSICFLTLALAMLSSVSYSIICIAGKMCQ